MAERREGEGRRRGTEDEKTSSKSSNVGEVGGVGVPGSRAEAFAIQQKRTNRKHKKHSSGTRKIANLIAERGGEAVRDVEATMGWRSGGRERRRFHP